MITLSTPDGPVSIFDDKDIHETIEQYIGKEFADYVQDCISEQDAEMYEAELRFNSDLRSYEQSCENWHNLMLDTSDKLDEIIHYMEDSKRINKDKIYSRLLEITNTLGGEL